MLCCRSLSAILASALTASAAFAQGYPSQVIKLVVAATPGTSMDSIARVVAPKLAQRLEQAAVVENRAGASGAIGTDFVAKAIADGHTLLVGAQSMVVVPHLNRSLPYNPLTDFAPISLVAYGTLILVTHPRSGFGTVAEMIAVAKAAPTKLSYSSPGVGLPQHLAMELIKDVAGIELLHVPYKGSAGALTDLISGQVSASLIPLQVGLPQIKGGKLRALAVPGAQRHAKAPDVPTLQESGVKGVDAIATLANYFLAPRGTPTAIVTRLNSELRSIMQLPDVKATLETSGLDVATSTPEEAQAMLQRASASAGQIIRKNNITVD